MRLLILLFLLSLATICRADFVINNNFRQAYLHIIDLRYEEAINLIELEKRTNPSNNAVVLLENYIDYFSVFITEREDLFKKWKDRKEERLNQIKKDKASENKPFYLFAQAQIHLQLAVVRFKFKEYLAGGYEIRKAFKMLLKNQEKYPNFSPNLMCLGMIHALIGTVPEEYKWLASMVGMEGTIQQGISELNKVTYQAAGENFDYLIPESAVLQSLLNLYLQKDYPAAEKILNYVDKVHPGYNPIICFVATALYQHTGRNEMALARLQQRKVALKSAPIPYLDYLEGILFLNKLDFSAETSFLKYINTYTGKSFIKAAYQKLAWISLLQGDIKKYYTYIKLCKEKSEALTDEDKQANNEAISGEVPNVYLLRARLYFDGGYYKKALAEISSLPFEKFPRERDKVELTYRMARIYHKSGELEKAIENYLKTLHTGEKLKYHFAANSALELGFLYEQKKDMEKARQYFKRCLAMRDHEYQNGIDQKAKAGLNRVGEK